MIVRTYTYDNKECIFKVHRSVVSQRKLVKVKIYE